MQVITVLTDTDNYGFTNYLKPSCAYYNYELIVLEYEDEFFSNRLKDVLLFEYIKTLPDNEVIFFTDGTDVSLLAGADEIITKYEKFAAPLVFSTEINCWPDRALEREYPATGHRFKYLNSGGFIGQAGYLKYLYRKYPFFEFHFDKYSWSNQYYWHQIYLLHQEEIRLDHHCEIFYTTSAEIENLNQLMADQRDEEKLKQLYQSVKMRLENEMIYFDNRIKVELTGSTPCHIHFPGLVSKMLMEDGFFKPIEVG